MNSSRKFFVAGLAYQNDAGGQGTSYDYQDYDNQEYDEEPQPSLIPQFEIEAQHFKVAKDRVIRLPCRVDQLGKPYYFFIIINIKALVYLCFDIVLYCRLYLEQLSKLF